MEIKHISFGAKKARDYIDKRRSGEERSLKTSFERLNSTLLNGIDWYRIMTIAGLSGSGKSTILENLKRDFIDLNKDESFDILSFEFEMRIEDQIARNLSSKMGKSVKDLYSVHNPVSDSEMFKIDELLSGYLSSPVFYVDRVGSVDEVFETIGEFVKKRNDNSRGLIVTIDHVLLTKGKTGQGEKERIDDLMHRLVALKQYFSSIGLKCIFITLSQLNRDIETGDRVLNRALHYPTKNDIFAASSVYYCSDYVIITHKPAGINGIKEHYGPGEDGFPKGLPVHCPTDDDKAMIYWHVIKERFGQQVILPMVEDFASSRVNEYSL